MTTGPRNVTLFRILYHAFTADFQAIEQKPERRPDIFKYMWNAIDDNVEAAF